MSLCRAFAIAACLLPLAAGAATSQTAWPQPQQQTPAGAWPAQSGQQNASAPASAWPAPSEQQAAPPSAWPAPGQQPQGFAPPNQQGFAPPQQQQEPPCFKEFVKLRGEADKRGKAIQEASKRKVAPPIACRLFNEFVAAEGKLIKYASANATVCQIPKQAIEVMSKNHEKSTEIRTRVCQVAAAPPKQRGPSLSDALSAPIPDSANIKTGRGTFDTLSGSALGR